MANHSSIRAKLEEQLNQLVARAEKINEDLSVPGNADWEERASESESDEVLESVGILALKEIDQIKRAIRQIDEGTYGICTKCGRKIPEERLEAIPYAMNCMGCV